MEHSFTPIIKDVLSCMYGKNGAEIYVKNLLIQYINEKTKSANKGSKSRSSFANLYAIYVIVEDYIAHDFDTNSMYRNYEGAQFSHLFQRQRELPFGSNLLIEYIEIFHLGEIAFDGLYGLRLLCQAAFKLCLLRHLFHARGMGRGY